MAAFRGVGIGWPLEVAIAGCWSNREAEVPRSQHCASTAGGGGCGGVVYVGIWSGARSVGWRAVAAFVVFYAAEEGESPWS